MNARFPESRPDALDRLPQEPRHTDLIRIPMNTAGRSVSQPSGQEMLKTPKATFHTQKIWNMNVAVIPIVIVARGTATTGLVKELKNKRMSGDHPSYSIFEID